LLLDGGCTRKLHLPAENGGQQQGALINFTVNVQILHPFLANGDTSKTYEMWHWGLFDMEISILGSKKTSNIVECFLHSQPPCGVIRTTVDYFLFAFIGASQNTVDCQY
jgi:hypothetical protein